MIKNVNDWLPGSSSMLSDETGLKGAWIVTVIEKYITFMC